MLVAAYAATGRPVAEIDWFHGLASLKLAAVFGHNLRRHREGRFDDPDQERLVPAIGLLVERGLAHARRHAGI